MSKISFALLVCLSLFVHVFSARSQNEILKELLRKVFKDAEEREDLGSSFLEGQNEEQATRPNIIYIVGDNIGWNDVGWNNPDILTPNMNKLAEEGVILDNHYMHCVENAARGSILTGRYDFRIGIQDLGFSAPSPTGLPLELPTIADKLKNLGYGTHLVGQWRLGFCKDSYTPLERGFDSFYGFLTNEINQFTKMRPYPSNPYTGLYGFDFRDNTGVVQDNSTYTEFLFQEKIKKIISSQDGKTPFFLYYATNIARRPQIVPEEYELMYPDIKEPNRRVVSAKMSLLDETVGLIVAELTKNDLIDNTLIIFSSALAGDIPNGGNNFPFRGAAFNLYEGGTKAPTFVYGKMLKTTGYRNKELTHQVDWFNTFISIAGGEQDPEADGIDIWTTISDGNPLERNEIIYSLDIERPTSAAIRIGKYKLIIGNPEKIYPQRSRTTGTYPVPKDSDDLKSFDIYAPEINCFGSPESCVTLPPLTVRELYDLENDPFEERNLAEKLPDVVDELWSRLYSLRRGVRKSIFKRLNPRGSNPNNFGGVWSPGWC